MKNFLRGKKSEMPEKLNTAAKNAGLFIMEQFIDNKQ